MTGSGTIGDHVTGGPTRHIPVLIKEVIETIAPVDGGFYIDATFGAGGYSSALLKSANCKIFAIDRDPEAVRLGADLQKEFPHQLTLALGRFSRMIDIVNAHGYQAVDGIMFDVGVSSMQLDQQARGFSFLADGPLDMRMSQEGQTAADIVNNYPEEDLAEILYLFGEERKSRAIAAAIVRRRQCRPIERTGDLSELVAKVLGSRREQKKHPATRTFQALRLYVNGELEELAEGLSQAERLLKAGGRLAVVTFHSLEDRIVKRFFTERCGQKSRPSRHRPEPPSNPQDPSFRALIKGQISPKEEEIQRNPRARSAHLRAAERTTAPSSPPDVNTVGVPTMNPVG